MRITRRCTTAFLAAATVALFAYGCDDDADEQQVPTEQQQQTHGEPLPEDFAGVDCVPGDREQSDSEAEALLYGVVSVPVDSEQKPVGSAEVTLAKTGEHGTYETAIATSDTDDEGRWCFQLGADRPGAESLMVASTVDDTKLRRLVSSEGRLAIDARSEALVQFLVDEGHQLHRLDPDQFERLDELSVEVTSDVQPREGAGVDSLVARMRETLESTPDVVELSDTLFEE